MQYLHHILRITDSESLKRRIEEMQMKKILVAYIFLLLDLQLAMHIAYFGFVLPLVGTFFLINGFWELANENEQFERCIPFVMMTLFVRIVVFIAMAVHLVPYDTVWNVGYSLVILLLFFLLTHRMLHVFRDIEQENNLVPISQFCVIAEICLSIISVACILENHESAQYMSFLFLSILASGLFLFALYQLQNVYLRFEKSA